MMKFRNDKGFTLIEILLVVAIMGVMLAVIVPRAWRANIDAKYGLVRQNASELAAMANQWAEKAISAQDEIISTATLADYYASLAVRSGDAEKPATAYTALPSCWVADARTVNWNNSAAGITIAGRYLNGDSGTNMAPEDAVEDLTPPDKIPRNPFNGISVFELPNNPLTAGNAVPGALACGAVAESDDTGGGWAYYALVFQGTENNEIGVGNADSFHGGQDTQTLAGLRNGTFLGRAR